MVAGQPVNLEDKVVLEEEEANDGEEVDENEGQQGGQQDGAAIAGHALDDIEQGLLTVNEVKELQGRDKALRAWGCRRAQGLCGCPWFPKASPVVCAWAGTALPAGPVWRLLEGTWGCQSKERDGPRAGRCHTQREGTANSDGALATYDPCALARFILTLF